MKIDIKLIEICFCCEFLIQFHHLKYLSIQIDKFIHCLLVSFHTFSFYAQHNRVKFLFQLCFFFFYFFCCCCSHQFTVKLLMASFINAYQYLKLLRVADFSFRFDFGLTYTIYVYVIYDLCIQLKQSTHSIFDIYFERLIKLLRCYGFFGRCCCCFCHRLADVMWKLRSIRFLTDMPEIAETRNKNEFERNVCMYVDVL